LEIFWATDDGKAIEESEDEEGEVVTNSLKEESND